MILLVCQRNVKDRTYGRKSEFKFTYPEKEVPKIGDLVESCRKHLALSATAQVSLAKYVPHAFEWKWMNPAEIIIEKKGKKQKTEVKTPASEVDLRKFPYLLKDGDIIGLRVEEEGCEDDFQTEADQVAKEEFRIEQEKERQERAKG